MKTKELKRMTYNKYQIKEVADYLRFLMPQCQVFTFSGPLGAGKTTIVRELLTSVGVEEPITSPTFTYLNVYSNKVGHTFYHFDLYRVESLESFCAAGFDEYLYLPNSWAFIEWPEPVMPLLRYAACCVQIDYHDENRQAIITISEDNEGRVSIR